MPANNEGRSKWGLGRFLPGHQAPMPPVVPIPASEPEINIEQYTESPAYQRLSARFQGTGMRTTGIPVGFLTVGDAFDIGDLYHSIAYKNVQRAQGIQGPVIVSHYLRRIGDLLNESPSIDPAMRAELEDAWQQVVSAYRQGDTPLERSHPLYQVPLGDLDGKTLADTYGEIKIFHLTRPELYPVYGRYVTNAELPVAARPYKLIFAPEIPGLHTPDEAMVKQVFGSLDMYANFF